VQPDIGDMSGDALARALDLHRENGQDIKKVWTNWRTAPSKRELAETLWPILRGKIDKAANDDTVEPPNHCDSSY
jgi:hypothetical protein